MKKARRAGAPMGWSIAPVLIAKQDGFAPANASFSP
jgi:hypothetical protein